jgi:LAO/AO transport system kinase
VKASAADLEKRVLAGELTPALAAQQILQTFLGETDSAPAATVVPSSGSASPG